MSCAAELRLLLFLGKEVCHAAGLEPYWRVDRGLRYCAHLRKECITACILFCGEFEDRGRQHPGLSPASALDDAEILRLAEPQPSAAGKTTHAPEIGHRQSTPPARWRVEMPQGQWRSGFQSLDGDVTAHLPDDWQIEKLGNGKLPVMFKVGNDDFEKVVGFSGNQVEGDDLGHGEDSLFEGQSPVIGMAFDLDANE